MCLFLKAVDPACVSAQAKIAWGHAAAAASCISGYRIMINQTGFLLRNGSLTDGSRLFYVEHGYLSGKELPIF